MSTDWREVLDAYDWSLSYVHLDEREDSVTLGFGRRAGSEGLEFHVVFTGVEGLRVTGWGATEAQRVRVSGVEEGGYDVLLGREESGIRFRAAGARLGGRRSGPVGSDQAAVDEDAPAPGRSYRFL
ncbi:hypothetical protein AB0D59_34085 [Streptomyces sp. NPDC048417]|uniref:hypothetical protein n=1 Tax=Streptomyces sp. NPDC048417 TaxID=3155387 RepID=UPI00342B22FB